MANKFMNWMRRGWNKAAAVRNKWPFQYITEISIKIGNTRIAKWEMKLQAKSDQHAKQIAAAYVRDNLKIGYDIRRAKKDKRRQKSGGK